MFTLSVAKHTHTIVHITHRGYSQMSNGMVVHADCNVMVEGPQVYNSALFLLRVEPSNQSNSISMKILDAFQIAVDL